MCRYEDMRTNDDMDFIATYLEHYGWATLTPFVTSTQAEEQDEPMRVTKELPRDARHPDAVNIKRRSA